jgi:hypothetical protein
LWSGGTRIHCEARTQASRKDTSKISHQKRTTAGMAPR